MKRCLPSVVAALVVVLGNLPLPAADPKPAGEPVSPPAPAPATSEERLEIPSFQEIEQMSEALKHELRDKLLEEIAPGSLTDEEIDRLRKVQTEMFGPDRFIRDLGATVHQLNSAPMN